jgi:hypothetical protein
MSAAGSMGLERGKRKAIVLAHEAGIVRHIGRDGSPLTDAAPAPSAPPADFGCQPTIGRALAISNLGENVRFGR